MIRKLIQLFAVVLLLFETPLSAQQTGVAAAAGSEAAQENNWQVWLFASGAVVTAVAGILIIALVDSGAHTH